MSVQLPSLNLSTAVAGNSGTIDISKMRNTQAPINPQDDAGYAHLLLINETATGLDVYPSQSQNQHTPVPAGRPAVITVPPGEASIIYLVTYTLPTAYVETCLVYYYAPGETVPAIPSVGGASVGNQSRVVTLPAAGTPLSLTFTNPAAPLDTVLYTYVLNATQKAAAGACFYLFMLDVLTAVPSSGTAVGITWSLFVDEYLSGVLGASVLMLQGNSWAGQGAATGLGFGYPYQLVNYPLALAVAGASGAFDTIKLRFRINGKAGTPTVNLNYAAFPDLTNVIPVGTYGNFTTSNGAF